MPYRIAGIDVHKRMLAVVVSDVEVDGEYQFERRQFGSNPAQLRVLADWLLEQQVEEVVMESTAQYWNPVWGALERYWQPIRPRREGVRPKSGSLHLAQSQSNRARGGASNDFAHSGAPFHLNKTHLVSCCRVFGMRPAGNQVKATIVLLNAFHPQHTAFTGVGGNEVENEAVLRN